MARYAIYFTPAAATPLWTFGSAVLGYDAATAVPVPHPSHGEVAADQFEAWTRTPRTYGFHATLKAPFHLATGTSEAQLADRVATLAPSLTTVPLGVLEVEPLGRFIALVPTIDPTGISALAARCVDDLDDLRAPLTAPDRDRRIAGGHLSAREIAYLDRYGYPHVHDAFRFHMTLTGALDEAQRQIALSALRDLYAPVRAPLALDALTLAIQPARDQPFKLLQRYALTTAAA